MTISQEFPKLRTAAVLLVLVVAAVLTPQAVEARLFPHRASGAAQKGNINAASAVPDTAVEQQHATRRLHDFDFNSFFGNPGLSVGTGLSLGTSSDGSVFSFGSGSGTATTGSSASASSSSSSSSSGGTSTSTSTSPGPSATAVAMKAPEPPSPESFFFSTKPAGPDKAPSPSIAPLTSDSSANTEEKNYSPAPDGNSGNGSSNQPTDQPNDSNNGQPTDQPTDSSNGQPTDSSNGQPTDSGNGQSYNKDGQSDNGNNGKGN